MKDLIKIKEALESAKRFAENVHDDEYTQNDLDVICNDLIQDSDIALSLLNKHIERLESEELVDDLEVVLTYAYGMNPKYTNEAAKAAIKTIKGE